MNDEIGRRLFMNRHVFSVELMEKMLKDDDCDVRLAAMKACKAKKLPIPAIRTIDPH